MKKLAIDLFCGLGGWAFGFLSEGYRVIGFDIERWPYPGQLVLQDVQTLHGSQFSNATIIVASPPCQAYSYMSMPWTRAKKMAVEYQDGTRSSEDLTKLFDACFRIQHEASEAAGRKIPLIVENVKGAQSWVGRAKWHYGSYYLWGDVPALMPMTGRHKSSGMNWSNYGKPGYGGEDFTRVAGKQAIAEAGIRWLGMSNGKDFNKRPVTHWGDKGSLGIKMHAEGRYTKPGSGRDWFDMGPACYASGSSARKQASAMIAKIPFPLAQHIARVFKQEAERGLREEK